MITQLREDGISTATRCLYEDQCDDILRFLKNRMQFDNHVKQDGNPVTDKSTSTCWDMRSALLAPHFFEHALSFNSLVEEYLEQQPLLYSINAFRTYPRKSVQGDIQSFHRDKDDRKFLALFMFLSDTSKEGAHVFLKGSHNGSSREEIRISGPIGTCFLADTRGLHYGESPLLRTRTMMWSRWGVTDPPPSYVWDKLSPVDAKLLGRRYPTDKRTQEIIRLIVR